MAGPTDLAEQNQSAEPPEGGYGAAWSEEGYVDKIKRYASAAGREVVEKGFTLYYTLQREDLPRWVRTTIIGALGYYILPTDAIFDLTPVVGYADDLGVLVAAIATVASYINDEVRAKAKARTDRVFPAGDASAETPDT